MVNISPTQYLAKVVIGKRFSSSTSTLANTLPTTSFGLNSQHLNGTATDSTRAHTTHLKLAKNSLTSMKTTKSTTTNSELHNPKISSYTKTLNTLAVSTLVL